MATRARLQQIVEYLVGQVLALNDLASFTHRSGELLEQHSTAFVVLTHEAAVNLVTMRDRLALLTRCIDDAARKLPDI